MRASRETILFFCNFIDGCRGFCCSVENFYSSTDTMQEKTTEELEIFSLRLRGLAEKKHLTQADIARKLGVAWPRVGNWFQGRNLPTPRYRKPLADLLNVNEEWLIHGLEYTREVKIEDSVVMGDGNTTIAERVSEEILSIVRSSIEAAGDDLSRLGWLKEQALEHLKPPARWSEASEIEKAHRLVNALKEEGQSAPSTRQAL